MKISVIAAILLIVILIVWGSLLITACTYTFRLVNDVEPSLNATQKGLVGWAKFAGVMVGIWGAYSILLAIAYIYVTAAGRDQYGMVETNFV